MNEQLRFSWGHIIAFLALIFIAYVTFMGITYYTLGDFLMAGVGALLCVAFLSLSLLGAQIKKGAPTKFYKSIKWERTLLLMSPIVLALAFVPFNHFWSVLHRESEIAEDFKTSITYSDSIFDEYELYAQERIEALSSSLSSSSEEKRKNRTDALNLLLLSKKYDHLKDQAKKWIGDASENATVWNVFLLGNVDDIGVAVGKWTSNLNKVSSKRLLFEAEDVETFNLECAAKQKTIQGLEDLKSKYKSIDFQFNGLSILTMVICFLMLLCPYFIQERHAANCERFWDFWWFSRFYDSTGNSEFVHEPKPTNNFTYAKGGAIEDDNMAGENKRIIKPKTSKGAPV